MAKNLFHYNITNLLYSSYNSCIWKTPYYLNKPETKFLFFSKLLVKLIFFLTKKKNPSRIDKLLAKQVFGVGTGIRAGIFIQPKQAELKNNNMNKLNDKRILSHTMHFDINRMFY